MKFQYSFLEAKHMLTHEGLNKLLQDHGVSINDVDENTVFLLTKAEFENYVNIHKKN